MKRLMTVAALALVTACAAQARTEAHTESAPAAAQVALEASRVACDIRATRTAHGVRLEAIALGDRAVQGDYDFVITAHSAGGSSDVTQGGPFALSDSGHVTVGSADISGSRYRAVLTLRDANGELCRLERRS